MLKREVGVWMVCCVVEASFNDDGDYDGCDQISYFHYDVFDCGENGRLRVVVLLVVVAD